MRMKNSEIHTLFVDTPDEPQPNGTKTKKIATVLIIAAIVIGGITYFLQATKTTDQAIDPEPSEHINLWDDDEGGGYDDPDDYDTTAPSQASDASASSYYQRDTEPTEVPGRNKYLRPTSSTRRTVLPASRRLPR